MPNMGKLLATLTVILCVAVLQVATEDSSASDEYDSRPNDEYGHLEKRPFRNSFGAGDFKKRPFRNSFGAGDFKKRPFRNSFGAGDF
ncbi:hypothetical protein BOX15_Mlig004230g1 [Macrostomum lignano]|uniref:Uncharacterized protein n=1 Tax=Macrostomum lignano TaxID=282301 RepID=A0A267H7L1_9PLAT|nr:hypothetical protein BOX15_Mlig004230g1 [Macrostomum lignano]